MPTEQKPNLDPEEAVKKLRKEVILALEAGKFFGLDLKIREIQRNIMIRTKV